MKSTCTHLNYAAGNELGILRPNEDEELKSWERSRFNHKLINSDFPDSIRITKANMLYISKNGFSHKALNAIKRLAAFRNPDFYKAQAMRLPTYNKPRVISLSDENSEYLCLPRGCEIDLLNLVNARKIKFEWIDETYTGNSIDVEFNGQLRDEQADAVDTMLKSDNGVKERLKQFLVINEILPVDDTKKEAPKRIVALLDR